MKTVTILGRTQITFDGTTATIKKGNCKAVLATFELEQPVTAATQYETAQRLRDLQERQESTGIRVFTIQNDA